MRERGINQIDAGSINSIDGASPGRAPLGDKISALAGPSQAQVLLRVLEGSAVSGSKLHAQGCWNVCVPEARPAHAGAEDEINVVYAYEVHYTILMRTK